MFEKIDEIFKNIEDIRDDINILLKRGSQDMPEHLTFTMLAQIDEQIEKLKAQIDALNKLKRELLIF